MAFWRASIHQLLLPQMGQPSPTYLERTVEEHISPEGRSSEPEQGVQLRGLLFLQRLSHCSHHWTKPLGMLPDLSPRWQEH